MVRGRRWVGAIKQSDTPSARLRKEAQAKAAAEASGYPDTWFGRTRGRVNWFVSHLTFQRVLTGLILLNALTLGLETSPEVMARAGWLISAVDDVILTVFVIEIGLKLFAQGPSFFRNGWNIFDFIVVAIALVPESGPFAVLRALRVLRVMRLVSVVPAMRRVVQALLASIPGVTSVIGLMLLVFYVFAVICTKLYGNHPDPNLQEWFGSVGKSLYSLFQIMTLESWSEGIVRPTMKHFPFAWVVFVPFILITSFAILNLFIAVIVNAMQEEQQRELEQTKETLEEDIAEQTRQLTAEVKQQTQDLNEKVDTQTDQLLEELKSLRAEVAEMKAGR